VHTIEPYYNWRHLYIASSDERSPLYGRVYNEFGYDQKIYNYFIHPQWDNIESTTMYIKILFVDYDEGTAIIELIGEWNDLIDNDIMLLKRNIVDSLIKNGIYRFIIIGENVLNFHGDADDYYEEWYEDISEDFGWVVLLNFRKHIIEEMQQNNINHYFNFNNEEAFIDWRTLKPKHLIQKIETTIVQQIG